MKFIARLLCCTLLFLFSFNHAIAQGFKVTGKVINTRTGEPLVGATVSINGTTTTALTDVSGNYEITVPGSSADIVVSYTGMQPVQQTVSGAGVVNFTMNDATGNLSEVVVVGYGRQNKRTVSGAISTLSGSEIKQNPVADLSNTLAGRVTGIISRQAVGEPGRDAAQIWVRGVSTFNGSTDPLFVIDGIVRSQRDFSQLDPNEIASVNVLKDASSAAIFGVRGANGVILVTTRRGTSGKIKASYTFNYGLQQATRLPEFLNSYEYGVLFNEALLNDNRPLRFTPAELEKFRDGSDPDAFANTDWADLIIGGTAPQMQHNLTLNGGTDKTKYFVSLGYLDQQGLYNTLGYKRYNIRSNLDMQVTKTTQFSVDISGRLENTNSPSMGSRTIFQETFRNPPIFPARFSNGFLADIQPYPNPLAYIQREGGYNRNRNNVLLTNFQLTQDIPWVKGLTLKGILAFDKSYGYSKNWRDNIPLYRKNPDQTYTATPFAQPALSEGFGQFQSTELQGQINYNRRFKDHGFSALVLFLSKESGNTFLNGRRVGYTSSALDVINAGPALNQNLFGGEDRFGMLSSAARINYDYKNKYLLQASLRQDQSENFAPDQRRGYFPAVSAGWVVTGEEFMQRVRAVDFLKVRGSWGKLGNDQIGSRFGYYARYNLTNSGGYAFGGQFVNGLEPGPLANPNLTWETSTKKNIGLEASFLKRLLSVEVDFFDEMREGILAPRSLSVPTSFGAVLPNENIGIVNNRGFEVTLSHEYNIRKDVSYFLRGNITRTRNKIVFQDEPANVSEDLKRTGRPIGGYYGLRAIGIFRDQQDFAASPKTAFTTLGPGDIKYEDINKDGRIDDNDRTYLGTSNIPGIIYGISGGFTFKGLQLSFLFQGASEVYQRLSSNAAWAFYNGGKVTSEWRDRWTPDYPDASLPRVLLVAENNQLNSSFWIKDASYVRLRNLELGYTFTPGVLSKIGASSLRVYTSGQNLLTFTRLRNVDPENADPEGWYYPQQKIYNFGVNIEF